MQEIDLNRKQWESSRNRRSEIVWIILIASMLFVPALLGYLGIREAHEAQVPGQPSPEQLRSWALERYSSERMEQAKKRLPAHEMPNAF